jgi:hypothetical protein
MPRRNPAILILLVSIVAGVVIGIAFVRAVPAVFAVPPSAQHRTAIPAALHGNQSGGSLFGAEAPDATPIPFASLVPGTGALAGAISSNGTTSDSGSAPTPDTTGIPDATPLPNLVGGSHPSKIISALHALGSTQTASDIYPLPQFLTETDIDPSTVHRIETTADGSTLWIGRTPNTICLLFSSGNPFPTNGIAAGASCPTTTQFSESGAVLQEGVDRWTWDGESFTTTIEH